MAKSIAFSTFTMPAALAAADGLLGNPSWEGNPDNERQMAWLERFRVRAGFACTMEEIRSNATQLFSEHVRWLAAQGWEAKLQEGTPGDLYLAAVLNLAAKWQEAGVAYQEGGLHRAIVRKGVHVLDGGKHPLVEIATQHPSYTFCLQQVDTAPSSTRELSEIALEMVSQDAWGGDNHVDFPMVNMLVRDDASYMIGLRAGAERVAQAAEQLRLEMNEIGGRASAAAEVGTTRGMAPRSRVIKIEGPFIVAINHNGAPKDPEKVVFAAYCDRDAWGKPEAGRI